MRYLLIMLIFTSIACQKTNDKNPALLGVWQGKNWEIAGKPNIENVESVRFTFAADGTYSAVFGQQGEQGTWRTEKDKLYTHAQGKQEIMVKVLKADAQTLIFDMNRGGQKETLELERVVQ